MTVEEFVRREGEQLQLIHEKLKARTYSFKSARRALIPKVGTSKMWRLRIPVVMDRIVGQSINLVFELVFDLDFTDSNFGLCRGKSQYQAIRHVQGILALGYEWCASIDLKNFFDEIPHNLTFSNKTIRRLCNSNYC